MGRYPDVYLQTDAFNAPADRRECACISLTTAQAAAADDDGLLAAFATTTDAVTKTTFLNAMPACRNVTITSGGTAASNIAAGTIVITGTDINGDPITEDAAVTADTALTFVGTKAFKTVTSILFPAMAGTSATFKAGWGDKYGLPYMLAAKPPAIGWVNYVQEDPTLAIDSDELEKNVFSFTSAPSGEVVQLVLFI